MKLLFLTFSLILSSSSFASDVPEIFKMLINGKSEYTGRATSVLDNKMENIQAKVTIRKSINTESYSLLFASNGNMSKHRSNTLFPVKGEIFFSLKSDNDEIDNLEYDGESVELLEQDKTFYILETKAEYAKRIARITELNKIYKQQYPVTGRFLGVVRYNVFSVQEIDFFEIATENELIESGTFRK